MTELTIPFTEMTRDQFQAHLDEKTLNTHDAAAVAAYFSQDAVQRVVATSETRRGRDEIRKATEEGFRICPDLHFEVFDLFASDDRLCVQCTVTGTHLGEYRGLRPTGQRIELDMCLLFRMDEDGLMKEEVIYNDSGAMLRQLGLSPAS